MLRFQSNTSFHFFFTVPLKVWMKPFLIYIDLDSRSLFLYSDFSRFCYIIHFYLQNVFQGWNEFQTVDFKSHILTHSFSAHSIFWNFLGIIYDENEKFYWIQIYLTIGSTDYCVTRCTIIWRCIQFQSNVNSSCSIF